MMSSTTNCAAARANDALAHPEPSARRDRLPLAGLLALAMACFITVLTEALPAGLLPQIGADLGVVPSLVGQLVTLYAVGTLVTAIPLTAATQGWRRRPLLLLSIAGFGVVNTITAVSTHYAVTLGARFLAGVFAGLLWALVAGYAGRMVADHQKGRAIAIVMVGIPLALSLGIPAGTWLGAAVGWRVAFGAMSACTVGVLVWARVRVPDFPGQSADQRRSTRAVFALPGVRSVLFVTLAFVLAHNLLYTYIAPYAARAGVSGAMDTVLLVFGVAALAGIWIVGVLIDRWLRALVLVSTMLFGLACAVLGTWGDTAAIVHVGVGLWGLAYGGSATLFQTASARTAGPAADVAQSMIVTVWNLAIAGGGVLGGVLLESLGVAAFPWLVVGAMVPTLVVAWRAKQAGFPRAR